MSYRFAIVFLGSLVVFQVSGFDGLPAPNKHVLVARDFLHLPAPKWQNGFFLSRELLAPTFFVFDVQGRKVHEGQISIPGVGRIKLTDAAIARDGRMAVSGGAMSREGAPAAFLAWLDPFARVERVVRTSPFIAYRICFTEDGALWALGRVLPPPGEREQLHHILRHYSSQGRLEHALAPTDGMAPSDGKHPAVGGFVVASGNRVGVYSATAHEWLEIGADRVTISGRWPGIVGNLLTITGVGYMPSGNVYVSAQHWDDNKAKKRTGFYRLNRDASTWVRMNATSAIGQDDSRFAEIVGTDSDSLVVGLELPNFVWIPVN